MKIPLLPLLMLCVAVPVAKATLYYVDFGSGLDSNNGTGVGTPWQHLPGDPSATGNASSASGVTGTIYLKGGVNYAIGGSGAPILIDSSHYLAGGPLTITCGTNVGWGSGISVIDGAGVGYAIFNITGMTNLTLRALSVGDTIGISGHFQDTAVGFTDCMSNTLDSLVVHDVGTNSATCHSDGIGPNGNNVYQAYHTITNCTVYNVTQKCIEPFRAGGNTIVNNFLWNAADHCVTISCLSNICYGNIISNADVNVWLRPLSGSGYGLKLAGATGLPSSGNWVYNNLITHCHDGGIALQNYTTGINVSNNLVANNTIIDFDPAQNGFGGGLTIDPQGTGAVINGNSILNNIFYCQAIGGSAGSWTTPIPIAAPYSTSATALGTNNVIAYNLTFDPNATTHPATIVSGVEQSPSWANFADNGITSPDYRFTVAVNGTGNSFNFSSQLFDSDPKFVSYPGSLQLLASSPAKSAGTNLSAVFTTDFAGVTRNNWSMGAFEFVNPPVYGTNIHNSVSGLNIAKGTVSF